MTAAPAKRPKKTGPDQLSCPSCGADLKVSHSRTFDDRVRLRRHRCSSCDFTEHSVQVPISNPDVITFAGKRIGIAEGFTIVVPPTPSAAKQPTITHPGFRQCEQCNALLSLRTKGELCRPCFDAKRSAGPGPSVCDSCIYSNRDGTCSFGYPEAYTPEADDCVMYNDGAKG